MLQVFVTSAANLFLLVVPPDSRLLDEQVDLCKGVLNLYRYMVMNSRMEQKTWYGSQSWFRLKAKLSLKIKRFCVCKRKQ